MEIFSWQRICLWRGRSSYLCAMFQSISRRVVIGRNCRETMRSVESSLFVRVQVWLSSSRRTRLRSLTRLFVGTRISRAEAILLLYRRSWVRLVRLLPEEVVSSILLEYCVSTILLFLFPLDSELLFLYYLFSLIDILVWIKKN